MERRKLYIFSSFAVIMVLLCACSIRMGTETKLPEKTVKNNVSLEAENVGGMRNTDLIKKLKEHEARINIEAINAKFDTKSWDVIQTESTGRRVNLQKTLDAVMNAQEGSNVKLVADEVKPGVTSQQIKDNILLLSSYTTPILDNQESRVNNIEVSAKKMDYKKVAPGEEFSFNKTLGKRTEAKGYEEAPIIVKTEEGYKKGKGIGGGVCQLASTLYNAVNKAGLEVTERHEHSKDVDYVPDGKDATVSYGSVDFKFRNNRGNTIMIRTYINSKALTVKILENKN